MLVSLTVGKVDAGVAVLLTQDNRLVGSLNTAPNPSSFRVNMNGGIRILSFPRRIQY